MKEEKEEIKEKNLFAYSGLIIITLFITFCLTFFALYNDTKIDNILFLVILTTAYFSISGIFCYSIFRYLLYKRNERILKEYTTNIRENLEFLSRQTRKLESDRDNEDLKKLIKEILIRLDIYFEYLINFGSKGEEKTIKKIIKKINNRINEKKKQKEVRPEEDSSNEDKSGEKDI
jgi:hypothetical protein